MRSECVHGRANPFPFPKKIMKPKPETEDQTIAAELLASYSNLTSRRLRQLAAENVIPPATKGKFPMPEAIQKLFGWYQRDHESIARERLLKLRAERKIAERQN